MFNRLGALAVSLMLTAPALAQDELVVPEAGYVISDNIALLPEAVREKRAALLAAAETGDIEALRPIFDAEPSQPRVSFGDPADAVDYLREQSADGEGIEPLAILQEVLEAPYAAIDGGDGDLYYVWPYLAAMDNISSLTPDQLVDAYRIVGVDGFKNQLDFGGWIYWRAFISSRGELQAFVAGD